MDRNKEKNFYLDLFQAIMVKKAFVDRFARSRQIYHPPLIIFKFYDYLIGNIKEFSINKWDILKIVLYMFEFLYLLY